MNIYDIHWELRNDVHNIMMACESVLLVYYINMHFMKV